MQAWHYYIEETQYENYAVTYLTNKLAWSVWKIYVWNLVGTKTFFLTKKFPSILFMQIVFNAFNRNFTYTLTLSLLKQRHFLDCNRKTNPFLIHAVLDFLKFLKLKVQTYLWQSAKGIFGKMVI